MQLIDALWTQHRIRAWLRSCAIGSILVVAASWRIDAQTGAWTRDSALVASRSPNLSRADLEDLTQRVGRLATSDSVRRSDRDAFAVLGRSFRERLSEGDFKPGDEILLRVEGQESLSGTFAVREKQILSLPSLPDICLRGVLHNELKEFLTREIGRFVRDPEVHASTLVRIAVLGEVRNPGYYRLPGDVPLSDALTAAGGATPQADIGRAVVRRNASDLIAHDRLAMDLARGATLDQLNIRAGDELVVGEQQHRNWPVALQSVAGVLGVLFSYELLHRR